MELLNCIHASGTKRLINANVVKVNSLGSSKPGYSFKLRKTRFEKLQNLITITIFTRRNVTMVAPVQREGGGGVRDLDTYRGVSMVHRYYMTM